MLEKNKYEPLVSIIMNCYEGENFLKDSIETVMNQTYRNWELIFWDNQSSDKSAEIFKSYKDKRFKYFYAKSHTPLYEARNLAIENTTGDFIAFLDTDDLWSKQKLELQIPYFKNPEIGVVYSNFWITKKNIKKRKLFSNKKLYSGKIYSDLIENYNIGILTAIIRKEFYLSLDKKFDKRFSLIGDFDFFLRLSKKHIFESINEPLAYYRLHGTNLYIVNKEKEIEEFETWLFENKSYLTNKNITNLTKRINNRKFVNYKTAGKYNKCMNILIKSKVNLINVKNLIILITPNIILRKIFWYHQN
jgi:glycosyltransferase involved in cell wall biosynthesis